MQLAPLNLEHFNLTQIEVSPVDGYDTNKGGLYPDFSGADFKAQINIAEINGEHVPSPPAYQITINLICSPKTENSFPYKFNIGATGFISYRGKHEGQERVNIVTINGCAMVYGILRDTIHLLTMRFQHGPVMLPTVTFVDMKQDSVAEANKPELNLKKPRIKKAKTQ